MIKPTAAEELLQSLGISKPGDICLEAIALYCNARIKIEPLDGCEARIIGNHQKAIITVAEGKLYERQRFSIGHELGHWRYHKGRSFVCRSDDIGNEEKERSINDPEKVADDYAVDLLMPRYLFEPEAERLKTASFETIRSLSKLFKTSITATALRYVDLSPIPSMLVCHGQNGLIWFKKGRDVSNRLFLKSELDPDSFALDVLYGKGEQTRPRKIGADAWFDNLGADRYEIFEDTMRIYDSRILTFLSWRDEEMLEKYNT